MGIIFGSLLAFTLIPVLPYGLWAVLEFTDIGVRVVASLSYRLHPLMASYLVFFLLIIVSGVLWYITHIMSRIQSRKEDSDETPEPPSQRQLLFFYSSAALEAIQIHGMNNSRMHRARAEVFIRRLQWILEDLDPRPGASEDDVPLVTISEEAVRPLATMQDAVERLLWAFKRSKIDYHKMKSVLEPMSLIFYSFLPNLPNVLGEAELDEMHAQATKVWPALESAIFKLSARPSKKADEETAPSNSKSASWIQKIRALLLCVLAGFLASGVFVLLVWYAVSLKISASSQDTLAITAFGVEFTFTAFIAGVLYNKGIFDQGVPVSGSSSQTDDSKNRRYSRVEQ